MNRELLRRQLIHHEGLRLKPYYDSVGVRTIGVGRNMEANPVEDELGRRVGPEGITEEEAMILLNNDIDRVVSQVSSRISAYRRISEPRQHVLLDMAFNLGINGLLKFQNMLAALNRGDYSRAASEMLNSRWANQVGGRARTLANMMRNNVHFDGSLAAGSGSGDDSGRDFDFDTGDRSGGSSRSSGGSRSSTGRDDPGRGVDRDSPVDRDDDRGWDRDRYRDRDDDRDSGPGVDRDDW